MRKPRDKSGPFAKGGRGDLGDIHGNFLVLLTDDKGFGQFRRHVDYPSVFLRLSQIGSGQPAHGGIFNIEDAHNTGGPHYNILSQMQIQEKNLLFLGQTALFHTKNPSLRQLGKIFLITAGNKNLAAGEMV